MMINKFENIRIKGVAAAVPTKKKVPDDYIEILGKEAIDSFKRASGVMSRYLTVPKKENGEMTAWQTAGDLACAAANKLLVAHEINPKEVGAIVLVTQSRDYNAPCTACTIQHRLGVSESSIAFDITLGCSGYGYGINVGASLINSSNMKYALVLAADAMAGPSDSPNRKQSSDTLLMGDAGTATLLERCEEAKPITVFSRTDGWGYNKTGSFCGRRYPDAPNGKFWMDDIDVFNYITSVGPDIIKAYMDYTNTTPSDYDCFALHQASMFSLKQVARKIKVKMEKIPLSLTKYGNTGPASIPLTICYNYGDNVDSKSVNIMMSGFGVGLSAAAFSAEINLKSILPVFETDEWFEDGLA